jgi:hypothetical protein
VLLVAVCVQSISFTQQAGMTPAVFDDRCRSSPGVQLFKLRLGLEFISVFLILTLVT